MKDNNKTQVLKYMYTFMNVNVKAMPPPSDLSIMIHVFVI